MKKLLCILLAILLLALSGCAGSEVLSNEQYAIREKDDVYYLDFHDNSYAKEAASIDKNGSAIGGYNIYFSSIAEMQDCIKNGKFSKEDLVGMQAYEKADNGKVAVCNVNKLYDVVLPEGFSLKQISWKGLSYMFQLYYCNEYHGSLRIGNQIDYQNEIAFSTPNFDNGSTLLLSSVDKDRNGEILEFITPTGTHMKYIRYSYVLNGMTVTAQEEYNLDESEETPSWIAYWGEGNGVYFTGILGGFTERPSYEWVTSFGLKPYAETETE